MWGVGPGLILGEQFCVVGMAQVWGSDKPGFQPSGHQPEQVMQSSRPQAPYL